MWMTIKYDPDAETGEPEVIVTAWGSDERPLRVGCRADNAGDVVAFLRFLAYEHGATAPRCNGCDTPVDVPGLDSFEEAA